MPQSQPPAFSLALFCPLVFSRHLPLALTPPPGRAVQTLPGWSEEGQRPVWEGSTQSCPRHCLSLAHDFHCSVGSAGVKTSFR